MSTIFTTLDIRYDVNVISSDTDISRHSTIIKDLFEFSAIFFRPLQETLKHVYMHANDDIL